MTPSSRSLPPRVIAAKIIVQVSMYHHNLEAATKMIFATKQYPPHDVALIKAYCFGTLRWFIQLQHIVDGLLHKPLSKKNHDILCLLCIAIFELMHMRTPQYAVVNETVNAAIGLQKLWAKGLINKILKQFLQHQESITKRVQDNAAVLYAHPPWLLTLLQQAWPNEWQAIVTANNQQAPMFLRINTLQTTIKAYQQLLHEHQIPTEIVPNYATALQLTTPCPVEKLPGFHSGLCSVQDLAGQEVSRLLHLQPEQIILDACAAPGSKTCHLLEYEPQLHKIVAVDQHPQRLQQLVENVQRLKLPITKFDLFVGDSCIPSSWWNGQSFDRILLDAPCSATGVIRRHPDIKLLRQSTDIAQHVQLQNTLLRKLWPLLKPGGLLLYTTCSILPDENENNIIHFLKQHLDAQSVPINIKSAINLRHGSQLLPKINAWDGFYYALLKKE